jgi:Domain of unknown function (DUF1707)
MEATDMSQARSPAWLLAAGRRHSSYADLRVSDAERTEVADLLSQHYGDGRLDQAEFDQRLDQAMHAKTYRDLSGLFDDLPPAGTPAGTAGVTGITDGRRPRPRIHRGLLLVLAIAVAFIVAHAVAWSLGPWTWIGLLCLIVLLLSRKLKRAP